MKARRSTQCTLWRGAVSLMLTLLFLAGCSTPPSPAPTPAPELKPPQTGVGVSAEEVFATAQSLRRDGRHTEALQAFTDFIEQFPDSPSGADARLAVGQLAADLGRPDDAIAAYTDLIGNFPDSEFRAEAYLNLGQLRYDLQDYAGSWAALQGVLDASPSPAQQARARYHLGAVLLALQTYREAVTELTMAAAAEDSELADKARSLARRDRPRPPQRRAARSPGESLFHRLSR